MLALIGVLVLVWSGCAALQTPPPKRRTLNSNEPKMYARPTFKPQISPDGLSFSSPHFTLKFSEDISRLPDYHTVEKRKALGAGDLLFLEGQYDFFGELFGFGARDVIRIQVAPMVDLTNQIGEEEGRVPNAQDAITSTQRSSKMVDGKIVPQYTITMQFGVDAFRSRATRAHELTHAFTAGYALPAWMSEGFAVLVEEEYGGGRGWAQRKLDLEPLGLDAKGRNTLQTWRGDNSDQPFRSVDLYAYSYRILKELQKHYGMDIFKRFFAELDRDGVYRRFQTLSTSVIVYYLSQAAGEDLVPFFRELAFSVSPLTREQILGILGD